MLIQFYSRQKIEETALLEIFGHQNGSEQLIWSPNPLFHETTEPGDSIYARCQEKGGEFGFHYELYSPGDGWRNTKKDEVETLKLLALESQSDLLTAEEGINPFLFIHIEPSGQTSTIAVQTEPYDLRDELSIDEIYNQAYGSIGLERTLEKDQELSLKRSLAAINAQHDVMLLGPGFQFELYKDEFESLRKFKFYYVVIPMGKCSWISEADRSSKFVESSVSMAKENALEVCLFPANATTVENIPGGSDSESYCLHVTPENVEKIIYKKRRASW